MSDQTNFNCPGCGAKLSEVRRFCPDCGARLPDQPPAETLPLSPESAGATLLLSPAASTRRLDMPESASPAPAATDATVALPAQPGPLPPPALSTSSSQWPGQAVPPVAPPRRAGPLLWLLVGGAGCLGLVLLMACTALLLLSLRRLQVDSLVSATPAPLPAPSGAGGIIPDDAPIVGGDVLLRDNFDNPDASSLTESADQSARYAFEDGGYLIEVIEPELIVWTLLEGRFADVAIACDSAINPGSELSAAGIIFHYQDNQNFYLFRVANDGYYALDLLQDDQWITLIDWTASDAIDAVNNRLRVETSGDRIALFVNGQALETTSDGTFTRGEVGMASSSFEQGNAAIRFDNLLIAQND